MISGVVAQEFPQLPRGILAAQCLLDDDTLFNAASTSGSDQRVFFDGVPSDDSIFPSDMPAVLTDDGLFHDGEVVFTPRVTQGLQLLPILFTSPDVFLISAVTIPGFLIPSLVNDVDIILPTPLQLPPGALLAANVIDADFIFRSAIAAAETLFPSRLNSDDAFFMPRATGGTIGPPLVVSDDTFFNFATQIVFRPEVVVDDGRPVLPDTGWDGVNTGVNISSDGLTAALAAPANYCGARSTALKTSGKFYFEITLGPTHGAIDGAGILRDDQSYVQMSQFSNGELAVFKNYHVFAGPSSDRYSGGAVITNNAWYTALALSRYDPGDPSHGIPETIGELLEGDVIGIAINLVDRQAWFRLNGRNWNDDQRGPTVLLNQDPTTGVGGIPVPIGSVGPAICLGGSAGTSLSGFAGDNVTANFGLKAYRDPPPDGYDDWMLESPFGSPINGDSFGTPSIGIPATLDDGVTDVTMSNGNLTATHSTTNTNGGAMSTSAQNSGRYYFEVTVNATHGNLDAVGILQYPSGNLINLSGGSASAAVYSTGIIWSLGNTGKTLGAIVAGDVIGVAVDISNQSVTSGGNIWFRKKHAGVAGNWNGDATGVSDPASANGGVPLGGFNFTESWIPCVGFSGTGSAVGDQMTANFGQSAYAMAYPHGYAIWPKDTNDYVQPLLPALVPVDDMFLVPFIDTSNRQLFHPNAPVGDDVVFAASSFGGNLPLFPALAADPDVFYAPAYFASFDIPTPQVTVSNRGLTVTQSTATANVGARSSAQRKSGKYYFEVTCTVTHSAANAIGIALETATYANLSVNGTNGTFVLLNTGTFFSNNANTGKSVGAPVNGDVLGFAIDLDLRKAWVRKNNGLWNNTVGADPVTNVSGVTVQSLQSFAPIIGFGSPSLNDSCTANFGASIFANPAPAGFGNWPGASTTQPGLTMPFVTDSDTLPLPRVDPQTLAPTAIASDDAIYLLSGSGGSPTIAPTIAVSDAETIYAPAVSAQLASLDGVAANVSLSTDKLTATHTNTTTDSGVRSTANKTTGKFYFEVTMTNVHGAFDCVGVLVAAGTYANLVTGSINCSCCYRNTGAIYSGNISSGKTLGAIAVGDVIGVAIDLTARRGWFRKNGGLWNGLALTSENPNTGTGGVVMAATVANAPAVGFGGTGTAAGDNMTANFGATAYNVPAPTGFLNWTT